jgi:hypothetical protein
MGRQQHKTFVVNDHTYSVEQLHPEKAYRFGLKVAAILAPVLPAAIAAASARKTGGAAALLEFAATLDPEKIAAVSEEARQNLILPNNRFARDAAAFADWFNEHPGDLFYASTIAVLKLVEDFLPESLRGIVPVAASAAETASA